jgi:hypothetical protein
MQTRRHIGLSGLKNIPHIIVKEEFNCVRYKGVLHLRAPFRLQLAVFTKGAS